MTKAAKPYWLKRSVTSLTEVAQEIPASLDGLADSDADAAWAEEIVPHYNTSCYMWATFRNDSGQRRTWAEDCRQRDR